MEPIILSDSEISIIKSFLSYAAGCPMIDGVFLSTHRTTDSSQTGLLNIMVVCDINPSHEDLLADGFGEIDKSVEQQGLSSLISRYGSSITGLNISRLTISTIQSEILSLRMTNFAEILAESAFVNGTILFDRHGKLGENRGHALGIEGLKDSTPVVENINCIACDGTKMDGK